jgi:hypothetical protein
MAQGCELSFDHGGEGIGHGLCVPG